MKLTQLRLKNFKLFRNVSLDLRPITLLTGANSSGKTTILNALSGILQTTSPALFPFDFIPNGRISALGSFREITRGQNIASNFSVGFTMQKDKEVFSIDGSYRYSTSGDHILPKHLRFSKDEDFFEVVWVGKGAGYK